MRPFSGGERKFGPKGEGGREGKNSSDKHSSCLGKEEGEKLARGKRTYPGLNLLYAQTVPLEEKKAGHGSDWGREDFTWNLLGKGGCRRTPEKRRRMLSAGD